MTAPLGPRTGRPFAARRRAVMLLPLAASCARPEPPTPPLAPMSWAHLTPLPLDVATIEVAAISPPPSPADVGARLAPSPADAVRGMARDRLSALGISGQAVFTVTAASLVRERGALRCALGCRLEISGKAGGGGFVEEGPGFIEAAAQRSVSGAEAARPRAADLLLRRAMDDLNVEFEFQLRRNLRRWLVPTVPAAGGAAAVAPPVGREELTPSDGEAAAPGGRIPPPSEPLAPEG
ncbi:MAG TPA: hypothetical protein VEX11_03185 [Acetobacteraceae bacterium]|nr:hypothetical protein [Acetobacteraceae bacterium]